MSKNNRKSLPLFGSQATATVSVALVLLILGIVGLLTLAAASLTRTVKEQVGFVAMVSDNVTDRQLAEVRKYLSSTPGIKAVEYATADEVLRRWQDMAGDDEDVAKLLGVNPFSAEIEVKVKSDYASTDSIEKIVAPMRKMAALSEITVHSEMVDSINRTFRTIRMALLLVALALLLISFGLINNTVRLSVYARRFTIYTMQLVGATNAYIRRPIVSVNMVSGVIAGIIAAVLLSGLVYYCMEMDPAVGEVIGPMDVAIVAAGMVIAGMVICSGASLIAANRYLGASYDKMFK